MKRIFWLILIVPTFFWLSTGDFFNTGSTYFSFRTVFTQYTGIIAIFAMSACLVLAARIQWVENALNGLDKEYRLHKWLGITALVASVLHFILAKGTKWAVGWGWLIKPARTGSVIERTPLEAWLRTWRSIAEVVGEYVFYIALILLIIALVKIIPYHFFVKFHKLLAIGYLVLVFHAIILMTYFYWKTPMGIFMAMSLLIGTIAAIITLFNINKRKRQVEGIVQSVQDFDAKNKSFSITLKISQHWQGHKAGQFAFVQFDKSEGFHPFTIASHWDDKTQLMTFVIKELGDYTATLKQKITVGQAVIVEGPYGRFILNDGLFESKDTPQIWVGAGIGITPFLAALEERAYEETKVHHTKSPDVDMFYCANEIAPDMLKQLEAVAKKAGVKLHIFDSTKELLSSAKIKKLVKGWQQSNVWFCGPVGFAQKLQNDFVGSGIPAQNFHREIFDLR